MKYMAEDFENANFAYHESGRARGMRLAEPEDDYQWYAQRPTNPLFMRFATDGEMAEGGWVPVRESEPTFTVTESEADKAYEAACCDIDSPATLGTRTALFLGIVVVPDPEPTNAERIESAMRKCHFASGPESMAKALDALGVKAPEVDEVDA